MKRRNSLGVPMRRARTRSSRSAGSPTRRASTTDETSIRDEPLPAAESQDEERGDLLDLGELPAMVETVPERWPVRAVPLKVSRSTVSSASSGSADAALQRFVGPHPEQRGFVIPLDAGDVRERGEVPKRVLERAAQLVLCRFLHRFAEGVRKQHAAEAGGADGGVDTVGRRRCPRSRRAPHRCRPRRRRLCSRSR